MSRTITALFDSRSDAEAAKARLIQSRVDADHIQIHDKSSTGYDEAGRSTHQDRGIWASIRNVFLPDEDRHTYEEGVRRGGTLLTVDVSEDVVGEAVAVLEDADTVDIDERSRGWRESGWDYQPGAADELGVAYGTATTTAGASEAAAAESGAGLAPGYGRREIDRGGVRARSYVNDGKGGSVRGLANEAVGNVKQAVGDAFGKDDLVRKGEAQERKGEAQQGKPTDTRY